MIELSKNILEKVSFDKMLFHKELKKSIKWLQPEERTLLIMWCFATFGNRYRDVIEEVYKTIIHS